MITLKKNNNSRAYSRDLEQRSILVRKDTFLWKKGPFGIKGPKNPPSPYSTPFLSALHQNKALYNFCTRVHRSIVERNVGLEYVLNSFYTFIVINYLAVCRVGKYIIITKSKIQHEAMILVLRPEKKPEKSTSQGTWLGELVSFINLWRAQKITRRTASRSMDFCARESQVISALYRTTTTCFLLFFMKEAIYQHWNAHSIVVPKVLDKVL